MDEQREMGEGTHERFLKVLNRLAERYGEKEVPLAEGIVLSFLSN